jgi:superfamily II DNA or RNA helicase
MSYFADQYAAFRYSIEAAESPGFRLAQLGAIHAAAAHFAARTEPGIITMPTGSGKTAVLIASAFVLRAQRVLIITPSRLVREQIAEEVRTLEILKRTRALSPDIPPPRVFSTKTRMTSARAWEALREFDVVVGTIQSISPEYEDIPEPPPDLFDLVLVDEAHHSPAKTWRTVLDHFRESKRLLFTATPFRQDQREIKGRFLFTYDLRKAYEDGVFGDIRFNPVISNQGEPGDVAIARAAERQVRADRDTGLQHRLMVRTDSRKRAAELVDVYARNAGLRLRVITGDKSLTYVKRVIRQLVANELDGIICVNMLGEGFNFPMLKIAAIHAPHRSLGVTLQFIGRFARVVGENL